MCQKVMIGVCPWCCQRKGSNEHNITNVLIALMLKEKGDVTVSKKQNEGRELRVRS